MSFRNQLVYIILLFIRLYLHLFRESIVDHLFKSYLVLTFSRRISRLGDGGSAGIATTREGENSFVEDRGLSLPLFPDPADVAERADPKKLLGLFRVFFADPGIEKGDRGAARRRFASGLGSGPSAVTPSPVLFFIKCDVRGSRRARLLLPRTKKRPI